MPKIMAENISRRKINLTRAQISEVKNKHPDWNRYKLSSLPKLFSCFLLVVFLSFPSPSGKRVSACPLKKEVLYAVYPTPGSADREAVGSAL